MNLIGPCHQNYSSMKKSGNGRFCSSCQKIVVDFSRMSTEEIKRYFEEHKGGEICGYSKKGQTGEGSAFENFLFSIKESVSAKMSFFPLRAVILGMLSGLIVFTSSCIGKRGGQFPALSDDYHKAQKDSTNKSQTNKK